MGGDEVLAREFFTELLANSRLPAGLEPATSLFPARSHHVLRTGSRRVLFQFPKATDEVLIRGFFSACLPSAPLRSWIADGIRTRKVFRPQNPMYSESAVSCVVGDEAIGSLKSEVRSLKRAVVPAFTLHSSNFKLPNMYSEPAVAVFQA